MGVRKYVLRITRSAVLAAFLVTIQFLTAPLNNQFITGTAVNLLLIVSFLTCGPVVGLAVAAVSPLFAFLAGVGPAFPPIIPFMVVGNMALIGAWYLFGLLNRPGRPGRMYKVIQVLIAVGAAAIKFLVLYIGIVLWAVPYLLDINEKQGALLTISFSYPQLITATIGGLVALTVAPLVQKAIKLQAI